LKKILLFLLLLNSLYADAFTYFGVGVGYYNENFTNVDANSADMLANLKVGYGDRRAYAVEISLEYVNNQASIFSLNDSNKMGMDVNLIKSLDIHEMFIPFFKVGIGAGVFDIEGQFQNNIHYGSFNLGLGTYIPLNPSVDIELCYTQKFLSYEGIDTISEDVSYKSVISAANIGLNVRF